MAMDGWVLRGTEALAMLVSDAAAGVRARSPMEEALWLRTCAEFLGSTGALVVVGAGSPQNPAALAAFVPAETAAGRLEQIGVRQLHEPNELAGDAESAQAIAHAAESAGLALFLPRVPADSPTVPALKEAYGKTLLLRPVGGAPFIPLEGGDPEARLSSSMRADLRRARRKADAQGTVVVDVSSPDGESLAPLWEEFLLIEAAGWKGADRSALAHDPERGWFFRAYARRAAEAGRLRMARLTVDGRTAAMQVAVETAGRWWILKVGYDQELSSFSPGQILMLETLRWAAARGLSTYEFLGTSEAWTRRWTEQEHPCVAVRAYAVSRAGIAALGMDAARFARDRMRKDS